MKRFYLDSNVVLDFLLDRVPYAEAATKLLTAAEQGKNNAIGFQFDLYHSALRGKQGLW